MLYIMYFNLKNGVSEEEFVKKLKEWKSYAEGKIEGFGFGKFYQHHNGANPRYYQMHLETKDYGTWDRFLDFLENARAHAFADNRSASLRSAPLHAMPTLNVDVNHSQRYNTRAARALDY